MPTTDYFTMNGEIVGETTTGSSRLDYIRDGLGSVVATVDQTKTVQSTASYKPFGDILASTGTQPNFGWNGTSGYLKSAGVTHAEYSVRARLYGSQAGQWRNLDPLWPEEHAYDYVQGRPTTFTDPSGLRQDSYCCCCPVYLTLDPSWYKVPDAGSFTCQTDNLPRHGVHFAVDFAYSPEYGLGIGPCTLEWWECSSKPLTNTSTGGQVPAYTWVQQNIAASNCQNSWQPNQLSCKYGTAGSIVDEPSMTDAVARNCPSTTKPCARNLWLLIRLSPIPGCPEPDNACSPITLKLFQQISYTPTTNKIDSYFAQGWPSEITSNACTNSPP